MLRAVVRFYPFDVMEYFIFVPQFSASFHPENGKRAGSGRSRQPRLSLAGLVGG